MVKSSTVKAEAVLFSLGEGALPFSLELCRCGRCQEEKGKSDFGRGGTFIAAG